MLVPLPAATAEEEAMDRTLLKAAVIITLAAITACQDDATEVDVPEETVSSVVSAVPSAAAEAASALCDHVDELQSALDDLQAADPDVGAAVERLSETSANLQADADALRDRGADDLATAADAAAAAIDAVVEQLEGQEDLPANFDTAIAAISLAVDQLPQTLCE
jgi:hypothetical protein